MWGGDGCHNWWHWLGSGSWGRLTPAPFTASVTTVQMSVHPWMESCISLTIIWWIRFKFDTNIIHHNCYRWLLTINFMHNHEGVIWPSLCLCTIINPILLTYLCTIMIMLLDGLIRFLVIQNVIVSHFNMSLLKVYGNRLLTSLSLWLKKWVDQVSTNWSAPVYIFLVFVTLSCPAGSRW